MGIHLETTEHEIGDVVVAVTRMDAFTAYKMMGRLAKLLGPAIDVIGSAGIVGSDGDLDMDMDVGGLAPAIVGVLDAISNDDSLPLELLRGVIVSTQSENAQGEPIEIEQIIKNTKTMQSAFGSDLEAFTTAMWIVLRENFAGFLAGKLREAQALAAKAKAKVDAAKAKAEAPKS